MHYVWNTTTTNVSTVLSAVENVTELHLLDVLHNTIFPIIVIGRYVHVIWYIIGFVGNAISARIWLLPSMCDVCSSAHYLAAIAACDIFCQTLHIFYYLKIYWRLSSLYIPDMCEFWRLLYMIPQYISELLILGFIIERLIYVSNPLSAERFFQHRSGPKEIVWILVSVTAMCFPQAYFWKTSNRNYCQDNREPSNLDVWTVLTDATVYVVVPLCTVILTLCVIVRSKCTVTGLVTIRIGGVLMRLKKTTRMVTKMLVVLSLFRVLSLLPLTVLRNLHHFDYFSHASLPHVYSLQEAEQSPEWERFITVYGVQLSVEIVASSRLSLCVIIYYKFCSKFRKEVLKLYQSIKQPVQGMCSEMYTKLEETVYNSTFCNSES